MTMRRQRAAAAFVGTSVVTIAAARSAALKRCTSSSSAFSPLSCVFSPLRCPSCALLVPFRDAKDHASKVCGKIAKVPRNPCVSRPERLKPRPRL